VELSLETSWRSQSLSLTAKGATTPKAASLADLARRRSEAQGQFFTPDWICRGMWSLVAPAMEKAYEDTGYPVAVFDNSVGSGRLLQMANPDTHKLYGVDIDGGCIDALTYDADAAGFQHEFVEVGLESVSASGFGVAIINPPFGLNLQHPGMKPYPSTAYGMFGPNTSAWSHLYALDQALAASGVVVALLPTTAAEVCFTRKRLHAELILPESTFKSEGANVQTAVYVFGPDRPVGGAIRRLIVEDEVWPQLPLACKSTKSEQPRLSLSGVEIDKPVITTPVTGNQRVELNHRGRKLVLKFHCGLVEAKVRNALLVDKVPETTFSGPGKHRYPRDIQHIGDGLFLLDAYLIQDDPQAAFNATLEKILTAGGDPQVSPSLSGYWSKLKRRHARQIAYFRHTVKSAGIADLRVTAKRGMLLQQGNVKSPVVKKGESLCVQPLGGEYLIEKDGFTVQYRRDQLQKLFEFDQGQDERFKTDWEVVHEGLVAEFPELAHQIEAELRAAGVNWLWPYQETALIELMLKPNGSVAAWQQGSGKARLAITLAMMSGRGLVCVESGLIPEMIRELKKLKLPENLWQVIDSPAKTMTLKAINLISYHRLKAGIGPGSRKTMAHLLRRRASVVIADEGGILSNPGSLQSRALTRLSARKLYILDGTPIGNYPRDILPLAAAAVGGGVAHQPYDIRSGIYLERRLLESCNGAFRGIDMFREKHVCLEWCTNEFRDDLRQGAKREIPKINNVREFRSWAGTFVQRRLRNEPEVAPYAGCPKPVARTVTLEWDKGHFSHYLKPAVDFARWFQEDRQRRDLDGKGSNLVAILARISATIQAANQPHVTAAGAGCRFQPITSKQRYVVRRLLELSKQGHKTILYATSPAALERIQQLLTAHGVEAVLFTGKDSIPKRTKRLDERFRFGPAPVLLASLGVSQRGLNLEQADHIIFYNRDWQADTEDQAIARTTRPDQKQIVQVEYVHLRGSIDEYMAQVVDWKQAAADSGLDWGDGVTQTDVFTHMDTVLEAFCRNTLGMSSSEAFHAYCGAA